MVVVVEKYIHKLELPGQVLSCLFIIDAIIKHSYSLYGANKYVAYILFILFYLKINILK